MRYVWDHVCWVIGNECTLTPWLRFCMQKKLGEEMTIPKCIHIDTRATLDPELKTCDSVGNYYHELSPIGTKAIRILVNPANGLNITFIVDMNMNIKRWIQWLNDEFKKSENKSKSIETSISLIELIYTHFRWERANRFEWNIQATIVNLNLNELNYFRRSYCLPQILRI